MKQFSASNEARSWLIVGLLVLINGVSSTNAEELQGKAIQVLNQNSFLLGSEKWHIALCGVSYRPEGSEQFNESKHFLEKTLGEDQIQCRREGEGTPCDGRIGNMPGDIIYAQCFVDGKDIAEVIFEAGYSCEMLNYTKGFYSRSARCSSKLW
ncbi:MAG: hypothetical protein AAFX90_18005 [Pseudomonadota bacterium]